MPPTTTKQLAAAVNELNTRMSRMSDELHVLRNELKVFKQDVAADINLVAKKVDKPV